MVQRMFNTLTKQLDVFTPRTPGTVNLFVCGPTVYDYSHAGHAKTYTQFDFIARYLQRTYNVNYLVNITDIDDKIIARAHQNQVDPFELTREYEHHFLDDMEWLGNTSVTQVARAHDYINQIVDQIVRLRDKGVAYQLDDGWYFDLASQPAYGKLSGRVTLQAEDAVSRIDDSFNKRNVGDFALWKAAKPGDPSWDSVLGAGRPGWHIEDTAITEAVFGPQYDIHGGAQDLIFPHHEAEIAQMETVSGLQPMVNYWLHTGFLRVGDMKMGKSLNNFITIKELKSKYDALTLRYLFLSNHYRSSLELTEETVALAKAGRARIENFYHRINKIEDTSDTLNRVAEASAAFYRKLDNDFNTPEALAVLFDFIRNSNHENLLHGPAAKKFIEDINGLFAAFNLEAETGLDERMQGLINQRNQFRAGKNFAAADDIRNQLLEEGVILEDTPDGTRWSSLK